MKTCSAALVPSSGSPDQMTKSARRPGARLPISPPMPIASAGRDVIIASASPQLTPVAPGIFCRATRLPAYCRSMNRLRVSLSSIIPIETLTPAARIRPTFDWVAAICSNDAGRSFTAEAITGTPARAIRSATVQPSLAPTSTIFSAGNSRLSVEHLEDVARSLDVDEQILPPLQHRHQRRRVETRQQHVLAAARSGAVDPRFVGIADDRPIALVRRLPARCRHRRGVTAKLARPRAARCGTGRAPTSASRRPSPAPVSPSSTNWNFRGAVIGSMSAPVSITAPCPAKMFLPASGRDERARHAVGAVDGDGRVERIDRRNDVDGRVERPVGGGVVGRARRIGFAPAIFLARGQVDFGEAQAREAGDDPRRHPLAGRIDHLRSGGQLHAHVAGGDDAPVAHDDHAIGDRLRAVAERDRAAGDGEGLGGMAGTATAASSAARRARVISCLPRPAGRARSRSPAAAWDRWRRTSAPRRSTPFAAACNR